MPTPDLDDIQRSILAFICRHIPPEADPPVFETRNTICGELRLALHEYDQACMGLTRQRLIVTDPPYANDCDSIAPSPAGREIIHDM
jgi:hypothetical protein